MQKTLTIQGKRFTARKIAKLFDPKKVTNGDDYIVVLNGQKFYANYRQIQDDNLAPTCVKNEANAIALMPDNGFFKWSIWLEYSLPKQGGDSTSEAKAAAARANGRKGGAPKKS